MTKRLAIRLAGVVLLVLAPVSFTEAQVAGKNLALDFRSSTVIQGSPDTGVITGHIVGSGSKARIDISASGGTAPTPLASDGTVSMIVSDSGKTITYLDAKNSQYMNFRPGEMLVQAEEMGGVKMEVSGTEARVDNLGAGPAILGHPTRRYRVITEMTMTITAMGQAQESVKIASTTDHYFPTDIKSAFNPFASMTGTDMANMFGGGSKAFADKLKAAEAKLPKAPPLRTSTTATVTTQGVTRVTKSHTEVTSVKWVNADPKVFEIPAGYAAVGLPGMSGPPPDP
jgi:hypothetical protein